MNSKIQSVHFDADQKLTDFIQKKIAKLERFSDKITYVEVTLKLDKDLECGNKVATIALDLPGDRLVAERKCKTFEEAVDLSIDALKKQIDKYKAKTV